MTPDSPVRLYLLVFGALLVLTVLTLVVASFDLPPAPTVALGLGIAALKGTLVVLFFMHLKSERAMVYWPLGLTAFLVAAMFAFILWSEADHISIN